MISYFEKTVVLAKNWITSGDIVLVGEDYVHNGGPGTVVNNNQEQLEG